MVVKAMQSTPRGRAANLPSKLVALLSEAVVNIDIYDAVLDYCQ